MFDLHPRHAPTTQAGRDGVNPCNRKPEQSMEKITMANLTPSEKGLNLTRQFEGLRLSAYTDQVGVLTIGYGHTGRGVHAGQTIG
jgi:hypothetical protein